MKTTEILNYLNILIQAVILLIVLFVLFRSKAPHKKIKLLTIGIITLFSGDTIQKLEIFYSTNLSSYSAALGTVDISQSAISENTFPLTKLLFAIALGIFVYFFLVYVITKIRKVPDSPSDNPQVSLLNVVILSVLGFSLFVVISVFITIPYLNNISKPSVYTQTKLDSTLTNLAKTLPTFTPSSDVSPFLIVIPNVNGDTLGKNLKKLIASTNARIQEASTGRLACISSMQSYHQAYSDQERNSLQQMIEQFGVSSQNPVSDKTQLYEEALTWFNTSRKNAIENYNKALADVISADKVNKDATVTISKQINDQLESEQRNPSADSLGQISLLPGFASYPTVIKLNFPQPVLSSVNFDGSDWGIFGLMSQYLIRTGSSELVLLIGMLGFGLLGASLSSFQLTWKDDSIVRSFRTIPLVTNFSSVLARGVSAAIVVYLCTKAGLAIFSMGATGTQDANGYMLLLTCFVGAIYSDRVWSRINNTFGSSGQNTPKMNTHPANSTQRANTQVPADSAVHPSIDVFDPGNISNESPKDPPSYHKSSQSL